MPLFHTTLIEVHREYERENRASKDMVEAYKKSTMAAYRLQEQCAKSQADNAKLSEKLEEVKGQLKTQ